MARRYLRDVVLYVTLAAIYFGAAKLGLSMAITAEQVTLVWPPSGIALAAVILCGYRVWPAIAAGAFLANFTTPNETSLVAGGIALGNTLEAVTGAWLLRGVVGFRSSLERLRDVLGLVVLAALLSTIVSATIGVTTMCLAGVHSWAEFAGLWWAWWLGDATGVLLVAPLIFTWASARPVQLDTWRSVEAVVSVVAVFLACLLLFAGIGPTVANRPLEYVLFPFVIWAAIRYGQRGTTLVTAVASAVAIWGTIHGLGPFGDGRGAGSLELLQSFMGMLAVTGLLLAAVLSERHMAEEARERLVEALQEADRRKDEFLAVLAHELRNPLAPIVNSLELLRLARDDSNTLDEPLNVMQRQANQMVRLIDDLLDVSRITRNKLELRKEQVDLQSVLQVSLETSDPQIKQAGTEVSLTLPKEPIFLTADPTRLAQVFSNLLNNAAKFSEPASQIAVSAERTASEVVVTVRDHGIGIAADMLPHIFEMFAQIDRSSRRQGGLGIGLTLAKQLVEMHGGTIEAHSGGPGRGSQFSVRLPLVGAVGDQQPTPSQTETKSPSLIRRRVLVVDDSADTANTLTMILKVMGHDVRTAHDGTTAMQVAEAFRPELAFLDIGIPDPNGHEVARHIRSHNWGTDVVLVAVSGWGQDEDKRRAKDAGFTHHITKPLDAAFLRKLLAESS